jgi:hypothetical protein
VVGGCWHRENRMERNREIKREHKQRRGCTRPRSDQNKAESHTLQAPVLSCLSSTRATSVLSLPTCLCITVPLSVCASDCVSICQSICLPVCLLVCLTDRLFIAHTHKHSPLTGAVTTTGAQSPSPTKTSSDTGQHTSEPRQRQWQRRSKNSTSNARPYICGDALGKVHDGLPPGWVLHHLRQPGHVQVVRVQDLRASLRLVGGPKQAGQGRHHLQ